MSFVSSFIKVVHHFFCLPYAIGDSWAYINFCTRILCVEFSLEYHTYINMQLGFVFLTIFIFLTQLQLGTGFLLFRSVMVSVPGALPHRAAFPGGQL